MLLCCHIAYTPQLLARAYRQSLPQRREKARHIKNEKVRAASLTAGLLLRYGLHQWGVKEPIDLQFTPAGKPYLPGGETNFSLSHSGDYAVCAISRNPIGVDIQKVVDISPRVIKRFCTAQEQRFIQESADAQYAAVCLWALKESYLKASQESTESVFVKTFIIEEETASGPEGFSFRLFHDIPGYVIAVCEQCTAK